MRFPVLRSVNALDEYMRLLSDLEPKRVHIGTAAVSNVPFIIAKFVYNGVLYTYGENVPVDGVDACEATLFAVTQELAVPAVQGTIVAESNSFVYYFGSPKPRSPEAKLEAFDAWKSEVSLNHDIEHLVLFTMNQSASHVHVRVPRTVFTMPIQPGEIVGLEEYLQGVGYRNFIHPEVNRRVVSQVNEILS